MLKKFLLPLGYFYLLRVPLLVWLFILFMFFGSFPGAGGEPILRGIFDVASFHYLTAIVSLRFTVATLAALLAGSAIWFTSRMIIANAQQRFGIQPVQMTLGIEFLVRFLPLVAVLLVLGRAAAVSGPSLPEGGWGKLIGLVAGSALWLAFTLGVQKLADTITPKLPAGIAGYTGARGVGHRHQVFASLQWLISVLAYFLYLFLSFSDQLTLPTFSLVFLLLTLICWSFAALSFFVDRYRIPLLFVVLAWGFVTGKFPQSDHFYEVFDRKDSTKEPLAGSEILQYYAGHSSSSTTIQSVPNTVTGCQSSNNGQPIVLVATTGGGIQASAWTARVLAGLSSDILGFDCRVAMVSSVSGGSVGAMYFVNAYKNGGIPDEIRKIRLNENPIVKLAETSSLDDVAWGLAYPDLGLGLFPFLKGISYSREDKNLHFVDGGLIFTDRGLTLENSWEYRLENSDVRLSGWRKDVVEHKRPAVIFNSTLVETGQRFLLSTTDIDPPQDASLDRTTGRVEFFDCYADSDMKVRTAARLSATFPYVSPATRMLRHAEQDKSQNSSQNKECPHTSAGVYDGQPHAVDGGYYDNYGMATLLDWLDAGLRTIDKSGKTLTDKAHLPKILIVEIRASPTRVQNTDPHSFGFIFQTIHPLETLWNVSETGQLSHNALDEDLVQRLYGAPNVSSVIFEFNNVDSRGTPKAKPLNWHLTPEDIDALQKSWCLPEISDQIKKTQQFFGQSGELSRKECQ